MKIRVLVGAVLLSTLVAGFVMTREPPVIPMAELEGPSASTALEAGPATSWRTYAEGDHGRLAVLVTDTTSSWLGLVRGLKSMGIPFRLTRDVAEAVQHRVVLVYPTISGAVLTGEELRSLARFPESGGTLIGVNVEGGGLGPVFGFSEVVPSRGRRELVFDTTHPVATAFTHERERRVPISNPDLGVLAAGSLGYVGATAPLATFDDGTAAITSRRIGPGSAYAFGIDLGFLLTRAYGNREQGISRGYANTYEPALDVHLRSLLAMYEAGEPGAVSLHTVPDGRDLAVLLTHDLDYGTSMANARAYAQYEADTGIEATYFIQTKYVRDWNDDAFFNDQSREVVESLGDLGMEVGSHSVAHSLQFNDLPMGTGEERYPSYTPFVRDENQTEGATILGELRVSRFLLEEFARDGSVVSFRPGHLRNPYGLPEALDATGYRFTSSVTAGNSLTHLPFRLTEARAGLVETDVFEFPVTIEDEATPPLPERLAQSLDIAERLAHYGGLFVVLIHTDEVGEKLAFERELVSALSSQAWFGTMRDFGSFWASRDQVDLDVVVDGDTVTASLFAPEPIDGLTLRIPSGFRVQSARPSGLIRTEMEGRLVLGEFEGAGSVVLTRGPR